MTRSFWYNSAQLANGSPKFKTIHNFKSECTYLIRIREMSKRNRIPLNNYSILYHCNEHQRMRLSNTFGACLYIRDTRLCGRILFPSYTIAFQQHAFLFLVHGAEQMYVMSCSFSRIRICILHIYNANASMLHWKSKSCLPRFKIVSKHRIRFSQGL